MVRCKVITVLPFGDTDDWGLFANPHSYFLIVWRWSVFPLRWPVSRARGSSLCCRGFSLVSRTRWFLLRQYLWAFFINTFQVDGPVPFCSCSKSAFMHQLPCSWYQRDFFFFEWDGEMSQRRWKMIDLVLSLSGIHRYELLHLMGSWLVLERKGPYSRHGPQMTGASWHKQSSPTLAARLQAVTVLSVLTGANRNRKLTKAKSIYSW